MEADYSVDPSLDLQCDICGMREFYLDGGYYYCSLCNTQSQQSRHFVEEEEFISGQRHRTRVTTLHERSAKDSTTTYNGTRLSSWEVYNLVLKFMVEKLIEVGYPSILRDKVLELYSEYLSRREVIFVSTKLATASTVTLTEPKMNIYALYGNVPSPRKKWGVKEKDKLAARQAKLDQAEGSSHSLKTLRAKARRLAFISEYLAKSQVTDSELPDPYGIGQTTKTKTKSSENRRVRFSKGLRQVRGAISSGDKLTPTAKSYLSKRMEKYLQPEKFTIKSVLVLIFVALRQLGCKVLFSDILRLSTDGFLKVENLSSLLHPEELQLVNRHCDEFLTRKPLKFQNCGDHIDNFLSYMEINDFSYPSVVDFIPKFLNNLKLPLEFESLMLRVNDVLPIEDIISYKRHKSQHKALPELLILPMIVVILKMLFSFDDFTEKYQSNFARLVNNIIDEAVPEDCPEKEGSKLFVLEDWLTYHQHVETGINCKKLRDMELIPSSVDPYAIHQESIPVGKSALLIESCNSITSIMEQAFQPVSQLPAASSQNIHQGHDRVTPATSTPSSKKSPDPKDFTKARIDYIYNPGKYIPILKKAGYTVKVIVGDARNATEKISSKKKVITLFQPYKYYDDYAGTRENQSESLKYLLSLFRPTFAGARFNSLETDLLSAINSIGNSLCCLSLDGMFPLVLES